MVLRSFRRIAQNSASAVASRPATPETSKSVQDRFFQRRALRLPVASPFLLHRSARKYRVPRYRRKPPRNVRLQRDPLRSEEHTSELQSLMRISYAVFCLKKKK